MLDYRMAGPGGSKPKGSLHYQFYHSRSKIQFFGGGFGNGKTAALCIKCLNVARDYPGANMLLARETYPKLNDTFRKEFLHWCPTQWIRRRPTKDDNTLYLKNGTVVNFRYVAQRGKSNADGSTTSNLLSATYDLIAIDQMEDPGITEKDFNDLIGRLRGSTPYRGNDKSMPISGPRWLLLSANPTSNWVYRKLIKPIHLYKSRGQITDNLLVDKRGELIIDLFEGSTYENEENLPEDFIETMETTYTGQMYDRFLMGKWAAYEGLVYPEFNEDIHLQPLEKLEEHLKQCLKKYVKPICIEGYDFGNTSPSCYLLGFVDEYGRVFILDGFYKKDFGGYLDQQATAIKKIQGTYYKLERDKSINADPDIFKKKVVRGFNVGSTTIAKIFKEYGVKMRPADNTIISGISKVSAYLNEYHHLPEIFDKPSRFIYFNSELDFIRDEFQNYFWKKNQTGENEDTPVDKNDHAMDTIKYMLSRLPNPSEIVIPMEVMQPSWMRWHEVEDA